MKKQTKVIGIVLFLFLLVIFSFISVGHSYPHNLLIEEENNTLIQKMNLVESECSACETEDNEYEYPIMRPDSETLSEWIKRYNNAPKTFIDTKLKTQMRAPLGGSNFSLLSHLEYTPDERNQGSCGNCWAWAGTGVLGIALDVQENIKERLSVQYINSCEYAVIGKTCCDGGWLYDLADFYDNTSKAIPWSNTNASWQDGDASCDTDCGTISADPRHPITSINEETIITHNVTNATAIANIKSVLNQSKAVWFAFFLPSYDDGWENFFDFWDNDNETDIWNPDYSCGHTWVDGEGGGHAVLCVGYNDEDPNNKYWIMLNSWGNRINRPNGLFRLDMDMNYDCYYYDPHPSAYYSFYWQTLNVTFDIEIPKVVTNTSINIEEINATLRGTLLNNGSNDTTCYFLWNTTDDFEFPIGNESIGIIAEGELFSYNISGLSKGQMYFFKTSANNSNGWNSWSNVESFLTKPDPITSFNVTMTNSSKIVLTWTNGAGGDGAYIEFAKGSQPSQWGVGNGTTIDADGYVTSPFNHTNLSSNTHYYYKAWAYAENGEWESSGNTTAPFGDTPQIGNNKTNALPTITSEFPPDDSTEIDKLQPTVNVTVEDPDGDNINWTIHGTNIFLNSSPSGINGSKSANLSAPLPYDANIVWHVNVTDGRDWANTTYNFTTRSKYVPSAPVSLNAVSHNRTQLNLTWDMGNMADRTLIRYKQGITPPTGIADDIELYNDTGISVAACNLSFGTQYSFKAWSWNTTDSVWSVNNATSSARTDENIAPSSTNPSPVNNSPDQELSITWTINISDPDGDVFNWSINCSNGNTNSSNDGTDGVKNLTITGLDYNTTYTVWVNATDGYDWTKEWFNFATRSKYVPNAPSSFTATAYNTTQINITWAKDSNADVTYIEYNSTETWDMGSGTEIYNGSDRNCEHPNLDSHNKYFYQAWSWNQTDNLWNMDCNATNATTKNIPTIFENPDPENNSNNRELSFTWSISITDNDKDIFNWSINCSNGNTNSSNDDNGGVKNLTITGLDYNTTYTVWVNATDGYDWTKEWFNFATRPKYLPYPPSNFMATADGTDIIELTWTKGNKADNTSIEWNSTECWSRGNGTQIYNGTGASYRHTNLDENTQYFYQAWSWNNTDGCWSVSNGGGNATTEKKSGDNPSRGWSPPPLINKIPNADAGGPYAGYSGITQTFDGSGSNDSDGNIILYEWNFGDGITGTGEQLTHIYKNVGNYTVTLTITDDDSAISENTTCASVSNLPPKQPILEGVTNGTQDTSYEYTIVSPDPNNDTIRYIINWNDNSNNTKTNLVENNTIENVTHIWKSAGIYDVRAYATDKNNASSESAELIVLIDILYCNYTGYLIDHNSDGTYDSFYCNETWKETAVKQKGGEYLIDSNEDGNWNYTFDPVKGFGTYQKKDSKESPDFDIILVLCVMVLVLFIETKLGK